MYYIGAYYCIFDINYHPNIAHINMPEASVGPISPYVGPYSYGELNYCDRLHILITFISVYHYSTAYIHT